ncbi:hypothetical protein Peur_055384 [Populus x canadensis]
MALAGFLPLSLILNELYCIFASAWGYNIYSTYGFLLLLSTLLLITTALVYYRWWWRQPAASTFQFMSLLALRIVQ